MSNVYHQWTAVVNIVFTIAAFVLAVAKFAGAHPFMKAVMVLLCLLFPVIQPLAIYLKARSQALRIRVDTTLVISDEGFGIQVKEHRQLIRWKDFKGIIKRWGLLVLMPDEVHAYLLPDRVTGDNKESVFQAVNGTINKGGKL